ncbi:MAG TPA: PepSY-associated TM helix domain-containing protein [Gammaproteobacteria bacterium]|nr:PepSY-associated TM helix domain-containing protein [Gammaproteobacteria bacterium]
MLRKTVFWIHLACGVAAGLVVLMMSVTGVLLTYQRQILAWVDRAHYAEPAPGAPRQPLEALLDAAKLYRPDVAPTTVTVRDDPRAPVTIAAGRSATLHANPYTGAIVEQGGEHARAFFEAVTGWHRWFNLSGDDRATARAITGASNLAFLFLVLSGIYLWLPRVFKWAAFKTRVLFNARAESGKARDFNWHHVFGIWSALPLAVVVASAVVFSYPWANDLVYRSLGEQPPQRGVRGGPGPGGAGSASSGESWGGTASAATLSYDELFEHAAARAGDWRALTLTLPGGGASSVRFGVDQGNGGQPQLRHNLTLDAATGEVLAWAPFSSQSKGQQARTWIRFLHTGEALGVAGQTVAGVVSLTSVLMVWTGLALAFRRLIVPLLPSSRRRRASAA